MEALAGHLLAHPWRSLLWLTLVSMIWGMGRIAGRDLYAALVEMFGRGRVMVVVAVFMMVVVAELVGRLVNMGGG